MIPKVQGCFVHKTAQNSDRYTILSLICHLPLTLNFFLPPQTDGLDPPLYYQKIPYHDAAGLPREVHYIDVSCFVTIIAMFFFTWLSESNERYVIMHASKILPKL